MDEHAQESCVHQKDNKTCTSITSHCADVSVPIKLKPYATIGEAETQCCGDPTITLRQSQGVNSSCGCEITITQTVCIRIPLQYDTGVDVGETTVICKKNPNCNNSSYK